MNELNIFMISPFRVRCGISTYTEALAPEIAKLGNKVYIVRLNRFGVKSKNYLNMIATCRIPPAAHIIHCFVKDTPILTKNGLKTIDTVDVGDFVFTHTGRYGKIKKIFERPYKGTIIRLRSKYNFPIKCTEDHPFLIVPKPWKDNHTTRLFRKRQRNRIDTPNLLPRWVEAKNIQIGDYVVFPRVGKIEELFDSLCILDHQDILLSTRNYIVEDGSILSKARKNHTRLSKTTISITNDFCRLLGYYIAEGSSKNCHFTFSFNKNERCLIEDVEKILKSMGFNGGFSENIQGNGLSITCSSRPIASLLRKLCGIGARNKHLPSWWVSIDDEKLSELVKGIWLGDGTIEKDGFSITSYSKTLLEQLRIVYGRLGIVAGIYSTSIKVRGTGIKRLEELWEISHPATSQWGFRDFSYITKDNMFYRISEKNEEIYEGRVYNLEVEPDNSYLIMGYTAHNCQHEYGLYQNLDRYLFEALPGKPIKTVTTMHLSGSLDTDAVISAKSQVVVVHNRTGKAAFRWPCVIIPHGVQQRVSASSEESKKALGLEGDVITAFGFISKYKGYEDIIEAMRYIPATLLIAGGWHIEYETEYIEFLKALAEKEAPGRVKFTGFIKSEDLPKIFGASDIVVSGHHMASESGSMLTAIGFGKAVVAPNFGTFAEKAEMSVMETYVGSKDFIEKVSALLNDDKRRRELEANAVAYAETNSWKNIAKRHVELYQMLTE